jgi:hypothetical protein
MREKLLYPRPTRTSAERPNSEHGTGHTAAHRPKLLAALGVTPIVDAATGEVAVPVAALAAALGLSEAEMLEQAGRNGAKHVPADQVHPLQ